MNLFEKIYLNRQITYKIILTVTINRYIFICYNRVLCCFSNFPLKFTLIGWLTIRFVRTGNLAVMEHLACNRFICDVTEGIKSFNLKIIQKFRKQSI